MKKSTVAAFTFVVVALIVLYFYSNYKNNKVEVSVVGTNCETAIPEVYLLIMNSTDKEMQRNARLTFTNTDTKKKVKVDYEMKNVLKPHEYRQDTVFINSDGLSDFDCRKYDIEAKIRR